MCVENMAAWERYESKRNDLADKLTGAEKELEDIKKVSLCERNSNIKGTVRPDFDQPFFSSNESYWAPVYWVKIFLHLVSFLTS